MSTDGEFVKSKIADFVTSNKLPLVTTFTRENAPTIFESSIKKQVIGKYIFLHIVLVGRNILWNSDHNNLLTLICG